MKWQRRRSREVTQTTGFVLQIGSIAALQNLLLS